MMTDGQGQKHLHAGFLGCGNKATSEHPSEPASFGNLYMNGSEVFKFAVRAVPRVIEASLKKAGLTVADIDWLVLHQANQRILNAAAERLGVPPGAICGFHLARMCAMVTTCSAPMMDSLFMDTQRKSFPTWLSTATPRLPPSPWRWMKPYDKAGSSLEMCWELLVLVLVSHGLEPYFGGASLNILRGH